MEIRIEQIDDIWILMLKGELDAASSIKFDEAIEKVQAHQPRKILIDFAELTYISSAGLGVILSHLDELEQRKTRLALCSMQARVANVFEILGIDQLLSIFPSRQHANQYLNES